MRVAIVAIIVSALCVAAQAQKAKPCPSGSHLSGLQPLPFHQPGLFRKHEGEVHCGQDAGQKTDVERGYPIHLKPADRFFSKRAESLKKVEASSFSMANETHMLTIDPYSVAAIPIEMFFNSTNLSLGTAFVWAEGEQLFLITNWHNVSGKDPISGKHLSKTAAEPNRLKVWFNQKNQLGDKVAKFILSRS